MLGVLFIIGSTFLEEASSVIGKRKAAHNQENAYAYVFLHGFFAWIFMVVGLFWMEVRFSPESIPILGTRIILEWLAMWIVAQAVIKSDRSTMGFAGILSIPLLTGVDIFLGYHLSVLNLLGMGLISVALFLAFSRKPSSRRKRQGLHFAVAMALMSGLAATLYKYDLTHYNSLAVEQSIVLTGSVLFFGIMSARHTRKNAPWRQLRRPSTLSQSLLAGTGNVLQSASYLFMPAAAVIATKRALSLFWSVLAGHSYFHEKSLGHKLLTFLLVAVGLVFIVS
jgi:drug/metabolite transporter (DMT)-like permease